MVVKKKMRIQPLSAMGIGGVGLGRDAGPGGMEAGGKGLPLSPW
jgi:hypothetical protein